MSQATEVHSIDAQALRAYPVNVADPLRNAVVPDLSGKSLARANECVTVLTRLAARVTAPHAQATAALRELHALGSRAEAPSPAAILDGAALDAEEAEYAAVAASLIPAASGALRHFDQNRFQAGAPDSGPLAIDFYTLWGGVRLYALLLQARAAIVGGFLRDCEIALCCAHLIPVLLHRMSKQLRAILARGQGERK